MVLAAGIAWRARTAVGEVAGLPPHAAPFSHVHTFAQVGLRATTRGFRVKALQEYVEESQHNLKQEIFQLKARTRKQDAKVMAMKRQADMIRNSLVRSADNLHSQTP